MRNVLKKTTFKITYNMAFESVIKECAKVERRGQHGTWITPNIIKAYIKLHELGYAKSVEVWDSQDLVGGFYGIDLDNGIFCGESMFAKSSNSSKMAFITFIKNSNYKLIDCQVYTQHLASLGAKEIPRDEFLKFLN